MNLIMKAPTMIEWMPVRAIGIFIRRSTAALHEASFQATARDQRELYRDETRLRREGPCQRTGYGSEGLIRH
ncbi:hypothetical protein [Streptomyces sp. NPDC015125]|uniref:hypothetical protein n=1 Tax=Streptomyces sp. NPDC015125 TaxID=3364938 RepID=UPI0036FD7979